MLDCFSFLFASTRCTTQPPRPTNGWPTTQSTLSTSRRAADGAPCRRPPRRRPPSSSTSASRRCSRPNGPTAPFKSSARRRLRTSSCSTCTVRPWRPPNSRPELSHFSTGEPPESSPPNPVPERFESVRNPRKKRPNRHGFSFVSSMADGVHPRKHGMEPLRDAFGSSSAEPIKFLLPEKDRTPIKSVEVHASHRKDILAQVYLCEIRSTGDCC